MLFLTRLFGVTGSDAERNLVTEPSIINEIVEKVLLLQANSAAQQKRALGRGTHVKGTTARARFEVFDVTAGRDPALAARLAKGIFAEPGIYPAIVRFGNADPKINSDFKADVRSLSFSVDLTCDGTVVPDANVTRQDFSLQNATTLPINDAPAFLAIMKRWASRPSFLQSFWAMPAEAPRDRIMKLPASSDTRLAARSFCWLAIGTSTSTIVPRASLVSWTMSPCQDWSWV
jgi:hypothetical protein